ncbi:MAG: hypothetical protein M0C28_48800 [Candidatus Moduliflexus flocculans]|nr:hypothetical protein [Candidatus Moduliflexus flocculans]
MSESLEMYLETIVRLRSAMAASGSRTWPGNWGVQAPVHIALHELENRGLAEHERYGAILLTASGRTGRRRRSPAATPS